MDRAAIYELSGRLLNDAERDGADDLEIVLRPELKLEVEWGNPRLGPNGPVSTLWGYPVRYGRSRSSVAVHDLARNRWWRF